MRILVTLVSLAVTPLALAGASGSRVVVAASPEVARAAHTATAFPGGTVLITGGCVVDGCSRATATTELYRPGRGFVKGPRLTIPRAGHTATRLAGGRILVVGGYSAEGTDALAAAEVCSLARCRGVGRLASGRGGHGAVALAGGDALVVGGLGPDGPLGAVERFDARRLAFDGVAALAIPRQGHTTTLLRDGRVLVVGGYDADGRGIAHAELYDPAADTWQPVGRLGTPRGKHATIRLRDGRVLVLGGARDGETRARLRSTELFDPTVGRFVAGPSLRIGRYKLVDAVALTRDGSVVVAGDAPLVELVGASAESVRIATGSLASRRAFATATRSGAGVLVVGGYDERIAIQPGAFLVLR